MTYNLLEGVDYYNAYHANNGASWGRGNSGTWGAVPDIEFTNWYLSAWSPTVGGGADAEATATLKPEIPLNKDHTYYFRCYIHRRDYTSGSFAFYFPIAEPPVLSGFTVPDTTAWHLCSTVFTRSSFTSGNYRVRVDWDSPGTNNSMNQLHVAGLVLFDLTAIFGAGNEPTKDFCDKYLPYDFSDVNAVLGNKIVVENDANPDNWLTYRDADITSGNAILSNSMISDTLTVDTMQVTVEQGDKSLLSLPYATPIMFYHDSAPIGRFFIRAVTRVTKTGYEIEAVSAVGLLDRLQHNGGIYVNTPASTILASIFDGITGFSYSVANAEINTTPVSGWLPIATRRANLQQLLFSLGAAIVKDQNGDLIIKYLYPDVPTPISNDRIYLTGAQAAEGAAGRVELTEHTYVADASVEAQQLYDSGGSSVTNLFVAFSEPQHSLSAVGLTVSESGANYAIVSGNGTLSGKAYVHNTTVKTLKTQDFTPPGQQTPPTVLAEARAITVDNCTLISPLNSYNALRRIASYYTQAQESAFDLVMEEERSGDRISYANAFGEAENGIIHEMDITLSRKLKAATSVVTGWVAGFFGNTTMESHVISSNSTFVVPAGITAIRVVLVGGGNGGNGGYDGTAGQPVRVLPPAAAGYPSPPLWEITQGTGGAGSSGGARGNWYEFDIMVNPGDSFAISIGAGGAGGNKNGGAGGAGGNTTWTPQQAGYSNHSSAEGDNLHSLVIDDTGDVLAVEGADGFAGADAGQRYPWDSGNDVTDGFTIWRGGKGDELRYYDWDLNSYQQRGHYASEITGWQYTLLYGGSGGGAAYGVNGKDNAVNRGAPYTAADANGVAGATAAVNANPLTYGSGGAGGNGGGGGGGGGFYSVPIGTGDGGGDYVAGTGGAAGGGSKGQAGAPGAVIIYY